MKRQSAASKFGDFTQLRCTFKPLGGIRLLMKCELQSPIGSPFTLEKIRFMMPCFECIRWWRTGKCDSQ